VSAFGVELRRLRKERGMSLRALGQAIGVSHVFVGEVERGSYGPMTWARIESVARVLGVDSEPLHNLAANNTGCFNAGARAERAKVLAFLLSPEAQEIAAQNPSSLIPSVLAKAIECGDHAAVQP
jgi:transcriptional regulator with XRE-family HTH domain